MDIVNYYAAKATVLALGCTHKFPEKPNSRMVHHCALGLIVCALCIIAWVEPSFAQTLDTIDKAASNIDGWLGGTIAKTVAGIAVAAVGYACLANRLSWFWFFAVILGIAIIFGRKQIVDMFAG